MASDGDIVKRAFMSPWKLKEVVGKPVSGNFWRDNGIWKFSISHKIIRGDTVASLAVKYSVQVLENFKFYAFFFLFVGLVEIANFWGFSACLFIIFFGEFQVDFFFFNPLFGSREMERRKKC